MTGPTWVFLDVGNVLLDEDPLTFFVLLRHAEAAARARPGTTFAGVLAAREAKAREGSRWPLYEAMAPLLGETGCAEVWEAVAREVRDRFGELSPPVAGAQDLLDRLEGRFRLGLIANQGAACRDRLRRLGWLERFAVVALSEEVGAHKPDPSLFAHALRASGVKNAGDAWMVGDRLDNDVAPASALGMATARVRWPDRSAKGWNPDDPDARAYLASLERLESREPAPAATRPTITVDGLGGLADAIGGFTRSR